MGEKGLSLSSVARGARRAVERPGTSWDALSRAGCATTKSGRVLPQRRHLQSDRRADCPYPAVLGTSADKRQPELAASSRRWPSTAAPGKQCGVEGRCLQFRRPLAQLSRDAKDLAELSRLIYFYLNDPPKAFGFLASAHRASPARCHCCLRATVGLRVCRGHLADLTPRFVLFSLPACPFSPSEDGVVERSSPKSEIEVISEPPEEKVTARAGASCPSGGHVADIYLANINK